MINLSLSEFFAADVYATGDFESGLIENRQGTRLLALPETLIKGLHTALQSEVGSAAGIVLFNCGSRWGKNFYRRFAEEVSNYYQRSLDQLEMVQLLECLKQCWKTHGWGKINLNCEYYQQGFLVVELQNSPFANSIIAEDRPSCFMEAGLLAAFFSELSGTSLHCIQTSCESLGAKSNLFILGLAARLNPAEAMVKDQKSHTIILQRLVNN